MVKKLFETDIRDAAHRALEYASGQRPANGQDADFPGTELLSAQICPDAECRENHSGKEKPFSVWSGPEVKGR